MILFGEENDRLLKTDIMGREEGDIIFFFFITKNVVSIKAV